MSLERVRHQLAEVAEVAVVAGVADVAEVAGVADLFGRSMVSDRGRCVQRFAEVCRGRIKTSAPVNHASAEPSREHAEVAGVSHSLTRAQAHARTRAREVKRGREPLQTPQPLRAPGQATILRHCRCAECLNFSQIGDEHFCSEYIGGASVVWATGERLCDPVPDAWHYCARYRGPQASKDVWVWPRSVSHQPTRKREGQPVAEEVLV